MPTAGPMQVGHTYGAHATPNGSVDATVPTWTSADPSIVSVTGVDPTGLNATLNANAPGSTTITLSGQNSLDAAISSPFTAEVAEPPATGYNFTFDIP